MRVMIAGIKKLLILLVIAGLGWGAYMFFTREKTIDFVLATATVTRGDITATVTATGELNAVNVVEIGTQVSGTIQEIYVDYNSPVKLGQLIAVIDPSLSRLALRKAEASLAMYQASVQSAQAALKDAERKLSRNRELLSRKLIARSEVDTNEADVEMKRASLQEARSRVNQCRTEVEEARTNLNYTRITSPVNGVVIDRQVDAGQTVAASYQTPTLFKVAEDLTRMQIETKVDEADIGRIEEGQNVTFKVDAFPDESFSGKVVQVRIAPSNTDNVVTYTVIIHVDNPALKLKPGMTANVSIQTDYCRNALRIPVAALRFTPPEELLASISFDINQLSERKSMSEAVVWTEHDGKLEGAVEVTTGISDNRWIQLVKGRLSEGQALVINAQSGTEESSGGLF